MNKKLTIILSTVGLTALLIGIGFSSGLIQNIINYFTNNDKSSFAELAAEAYPNVKKTALYNVEEVQQALYTVDVNLQPVLLDSYVVSGEWSGNGYSLNYLEDTLFGFLPENEKTNLVKNINIVNDTTLSENVRQTAENKHLQRYLNYYSSDVLNYEGKNWEIKNFTCSTNTSSCETFEPVSSDYKYFDSETGELIIKRNMSFTTYFVEKTTGENMTVNREYIIQVVLTRNPDETVSETSTPYVVKHFNSDYLQFIRTF